MRIFDSYSFNIIDRVRFKDTCQYIQKMLTELGLCYTDVAFSLENTSIEPYEKTLEKYPDLKKYLRLTAPANTLADIPPNRPDMMPHLTSFSANWKNGDIYAEKDDWKDIFELYSKVQRTYKFGFGKLIYSGIRWYKDMDTSVSVRDYDSDQTYPTTHELPFICSQILHWRFYDDGRKANSVTVTIEATAEPEPRDTRLLLNKLKPYLGEPYYTKRECTFSLEEHNHYASLEKKYEKHLYELFISMVGKCQYEYKDIPNDPMIKGLCDKRTINHAFKGTGFQVSSNRKNLLWGMNEIQHLDSHNYMYTILFDRSPSGNWYNFNISIDSYNFHVVVDTPSFGAKSKEEAAGQIQKMADYVVAVRDIVGEELAADFGNAPDWYLANNS